MLERYAFGERISLHVGSLVISARRGPGGLRRRYLTDQSSVGGPP